MARDVNNGGNRGGWRRCARGGSLCLTFDFPVNPKMKVCQLEKQCCQCRTAEPRPWSRPGGAACPSGPGQAGRRPFAPLASQTPGVSGVGGPPSRLNTSPSVFPHASPPVARSLFVCPENVFALPSFLDDVPSLEWQVEPSPSGRRGAAPAASGLRRCRGASASAKAGVGSDHVPDRWGS